MPATRFILFGVLVAIGLTALILLVDYLIRPRTSLVSEYLKRFRYDEEKRAKKIKKDIWKEQ
jgi:hypothetical protein